VTGGGGFGGAGGIRFEEVTDGEIEALAVGFDREGVTGLEVEGGSEFGGEGGGFGVGEPGIEVEGLGGVGAVVGGEDLTSEEGEIGEEFDADDAEMFAGVIGEGDVGLNEGGGGGHARVLGNRGKEGFFEVVSRGRADFEVAFSGDDIDPGAEAFGGGVVGDLDGEVDGDAESDGEDVKEGDEPVSGGVSKDGGVEESFQYSVVSYQTLIEYEWGERGEANFRWGGGEVKGRRVWTPRLTALWPAGGL
jgi:hypothetical protein